VKVIFEDAGSGARRFCFDDWRFCGRCGRCHSDKKEDCRRECRQRCEPGCRDDCREPCEWDDCDWAERRPCRDDRPNGQRHVHEFEGSTKLAEFYEDVHNHRVAGISGEAIPVRGSHIHKIWTRTDFFDHFHCICKFTGPAIPVYEDGEKDCRVCEHRHWFQLATLIESPLLPEEDRDIRRRERD
jgi:hypothetical protein